LQHWVNNPDFSASKATHPLSEQRDSNPYVTVTLST